MSNLTPEQRKQWRKEAGLGVCSDPRQEFGRDYRLIDLLDALDEAEHERDRLREWKKEALVIFDGLQDLGRALEVPLGVLVTGPRAIEAAEALRAERDGLAAVRARVEALADAWAAVPPYLASDYDRGRVDQREMCETELRTVLDDRSEH